MLERHTNRHVISPPDRSIDEGRLDILRSVAEQHGARLVIVDDRDRIDRIADIVAESDRIRYLTPRLHAEMISELRWPDDDHQETGIDVNGLEVGQAGLQAMEILRRPEVMAQLAAWNAGQALGDDGRARLRGSSALAVLVMSECGESGRLCPRRVRPRGGVGGRAAARRRGPSGVAGVPLRPHRFGLAETRTGVRTDAWRDLQRAFRELIGLEPAESEILVLRLSVEVPPPSVRSRRRRLA